MPGWRSSSRYQTGVIKEKSLKALLSPGRAQGWPEPPGPACAWFRVHAANTPPPLSTGKTRDTQVERNAERHHVGVQWSVTGRSAGSNLQRGSLENHLDGYCKLKKEEMPHLGGIIFNTRFMADYM